MSDEWDYLTKKDLMEILKPYDDNKLISFAVQLQQGYVGFFDITQDIENENYIVLRSDALDLWYKKDIEELTDNKVDSKDDSG